MKSGLYWFMFGVFVTFGAMLMLFGVLFMKDVYLSLIVAKGTIAFPSLLFGIILLMVGGGLLSSTIAKSIRKMASR